MKAMLALSAALVMVFAQTLHAESLPAPPRPDMATLDYGLQARQIADQTWVIEGAVADFARSNGCNIINTAFMG